MSRLIDADKLMKDLYNRAFETDGDTMWQSGCWVRYRAVEQTVKEQPTIEERKKGKWICLDKGNAFFVPHMLQCSECGNTLDKHGVNAGRGDANYCPNCGSYNGGGDDEAD